MQDYQTAMGEIQDADVLIKFVSDYAQRHPFVVPKLQAFQEMLLKRRCTLIQDYLDLADSFACF